MSNKSLVRIILEPITLAVIAAFCLRAVLHAYSIPSVSMEPTLLAGDHILVTRYLTHVSEPSRGDVVVFRRAGDELFVKRIAGVPGDRIEIKGPDVIVNGRTLEERYLASRVDNGSLPAFVVPPGCYFLLGDNREHSLDSRSFGAVPLDDFVGKARMVFWSSTNPLSFDEHSAMAFSGQPPDPPAGAHAIRWNRIFHRIH